MVIDTTEMAKLKKKQLLYGCHINKAPKIGCTIVQSHFAK